MSAAMGNITQLAIGDADPVTQRLDFQFCDFGITQEMPDWSGMRGTRSRGTERVRESFKRLTGQLRMYPTAVELSYILGWIMGGTVSGTSYPLGDTLPEKYVTVDRKTKVFTSNGVKVSKARFDCRQGQALQVTMDLVGKDTTEGNEGTFPSIAMDVTTKPFMWHDATITIAGSTYYSDDFSLEIDNAINLDRFFNSLTLTEATSTDRIVRLSLSLPFGDSYAAYNTGSSGVAANVTFTNGAVSLAFDFSKVIFQRKDPPITGRNNEVMLPLIGEAKKNGSTLELVTTLDSTP